MTQVCSEVTRTVLVPGTGVIGPAIDNSWDASARSVERVMVNGLWTYRFDPVRGTAFVTGLFDDLTNSVPRPSNYLVSIRYEIDRFDIQYYNELYGPFIHTSGTIELISSAYGYRVISDGEEVWRS